jgi:hypothetical protein
LNQWAERRDSQALLPEVIRRLVYATVAGPRRVLFPSGESVQLPGWDGYVEAPTGTQFVPEGISCWELGTSSQPKGKADGDYEKRTLDPVGVDASTATFVFVTPRRWSGKIVWMQERQAKGQWQEVRAYDADDLEGWLMQAPSVGAWLAVRMNKYPPHVWSIDDYWHEFIHATNPPLTVGVLLAGREQAASQVQTWLRGAAEVLHVRADTPREGVAFLASCVMQLPAEEQDSIRYRTLVTDDADTLRALSVTREPLTIAYRGDDTTGVVGAVQRGHRVLLPLAHGGGGGTSQVLLARQPPDAFVRALVEAGFSEERAWVLVRETGRSISALQRRLGTVAAGSSMWARPPAVHDLIPILLAGSWNDQNEADCNILAELAGKPYDEIGRTGASWSQGVDPPLRHAGGVWDFVAPRDAWDQLGRFLTRQELQRFASIVERVFSLTDPRLDLATDERWLAALREKEPLHSFELREGLARTLVLLSVLGDEDAIAGRPQDMVRRVVRQVLSPTAGWQRWYSVAQLLPMFAEAAPDEFLDGLHEHLRPEVPELMHLFDEEGGFFSRSQHTHLLWALEVLAWEAQYLGSVTLALGRLASLDPGGKLHNRPCNTLRGIFLLWHPNTTASLEQRFQAMDLLLEREPAVGWALVCNLLPKPHDIGENSVRPQWRPAVAPHSVTRAEHFQGAIGILERARRGAAMQGARLALLVKESGHWPPDAREALLAQVSTFSQAIAEDSERLIVWEAMRDFVNLHRSFPDAKWALPETFLRRYDELIGTLTPTDPVARYAWLFATGWPALGRPRSATSDAEITAARYAAVEAILRDSGVGGVVALGRVVKFPGLVGAAMADIPATTLEQQSFLLRTLGSAGQSDCIMGRGFASQSYQHDGEQWLANVLAGPLAADAGLVVSLLLGLPGARSVWDRAGALGADIEGRYWREAHVWVTHDSPLDDVVFAVEHLLEAERPFVALELCGAQPDRLPGALLLRVLDNVTVSLASGAVLPSGYEFVYTLEQVFTVLQASNMAEAEVARREWTYLPLLSHAHQMPPLLLHRVLARDPALFAEVICAAFRARHREESEAISEQDRARAQVAYECLSEWNVVPGTGPAGALDAAALNTWVDESRQLCSASDRAVIGDQQIGQVLAFSRAGTDGTWPQPEVRALIERVASDEIERGLATSVFNQRGASCRSLTDGGAQERGLAARYRGYADAVAIPAPRTAAMLRRIADQYDLDAHREDVRADQRDLG